MLLFAAKQSRRMVAQRPAHFKRGARAIEAFPRRSEQAGPAELWVGPANIFLQAGFEIINDFGPYPVLRWTAGETGPGPAQRPTPGAPAAE